MSGKQRLNNDRSYSNNSNTKRVDNVKDAVGEKERERVDRKEKSKNAKEYVRTDKNQNIKWRRLDNTAKLFPVITSETLSNVFRVSVSLKKEIDPSILEEALIDVIPWFEAFRVRLRRGFFWYYFEANRKIPVIEKESTYPCKYIDPYTHQQYLFKVSYYQTRINFEVFHAVTDGLGALNFLKELTFHYMDLYKEKGSIKTIKHKPSIDCILDIEDSYLKNYKKLTHKAYPTKKAYQLKGEVLYLDQVSVIHGYVDLDTLKKLCKVKQVSITKYLVALLIWSIYEEYLNKQSYKDPIRINLPINLRNYFDSNTTRNFFAITGIEFESDGKEHSFEDILASVTKQMEENITKEKLEEIISYNVSSEKNQMFRFVPLPIKYLALRYLFHKSSKSSTTTVSNLGVIDIPEQYCDEIENFYFLIGVSKKQRFKCGICSYQDHLIITFTSVLADTYIQRFFFRALAKEGVKVSIESNGVLNENV